MKNVRALLSIIWQADIAWGGMLFVATSLCALLIVPTWQNTTLATLRDRNVDITQFVDDINDLEVAIQDMRLAARGYIITQNVFFHQQYVDASARQQKVIAKLIQDAASLEENVDIAALWRLKQLIDDWRVQRLDNQVSLVESNNVEAAEADFVLGAKIRAFDAIRNAIDMIRMTVQTRQALLLSETQQLHATNLTTNTILAFVALLALIVVVIGVRRQTRLLRELQLAQTESQHLMLALTERIDEINHQNIRMATAQDIVSRSMQYDAGTYQAEQIVKTLQETLQLPVVVVWFFDIYTHEMTMSSAIHAPIALGDILQAVDKELLLSIRASDTAHDQRRVTIRDTYMSLYPLGTGERSVGVIGVVGDTHKTIDALTLLQITLLIDNSRLFAALQREQSRLRVLFDVVPLGFVLVDAQGRVLIGNSLAQQLLPGLKVNMGIHDAVQLQQWWSIGGNSLSHDELPLLVALQHGVTSTREVMHEIADARVPVRHQVVVIRDQHVVLGYVLVLEDMRQHYELDRLKADFVSMISHELRTPLATIVGATTMLLNQPHTTSREIQHGMLVMLQSQGQRLQMLIEDVLNLSRIDNEGIRLQRERVDAIPLVQRIVSKYTHSQRRIHISAQGVIGALFGDTNRIEQIFHNILDNAEKYAPPGDVEITIQQLAQIPPVVQFAIRDYGTPLSASEYAKVFDRFYQVNQRQSHGGVGLGLTICKYFVEAHGGQISMHAAPLGDGTVVAFTIPLADSPQPNSDLGRMHRVLLVEDDPSMQRIMQHLLHTHGFEVSVVHTVFQAHEKIERQHYDVLIIDIMLPDGSGLDFVRDVRLWLTVPILMVTARASEQDVIIGLRAGVDDYMVKPFSNDEFVLRVHALCRRGMARSNQTQEPVIMIGDVHVLLADKQIHINGNALELTPIEYRLLVYFVRHAGQVLSHEQILQGVWGERYEQENQYLWVHISHVRRKLLHAHVTQLYIENVRGVGYRMVYRAIDPQLSTIPQ